jgi:PAS domain S-box-containing protein
LIRDAGGRPRYWQGVTFDITELKEAEGRVAEAESTYRTLVEQLPVVVYQDAVDDTSTALYISPQYERLFGYPPEARLSDHDFWIDHVHPEDRERVLELSRWTNHTVAVLGEYRFQARDGSYVWVRDEAVLQRDPEGLPMLWQGVLIDVTARKQAELALSRRDDMLEAIGFASEVLLKSPSWHGVVDEVLERFGVAARASRAYLFSNRRDEDGRLLMSLETEWVAHGVGSTAHDPENTDYPYERGFSWWVTEMEAGNVVQVSVSQTQGEERADMEAEDIKSLVVVPVIANDEWWGYLGLDDCQSERVWSSAEIEALKTAADTLGAAIGRTRAEAQRVEAETRYRKLVEAIPAVTYIQDADSEGNITYVSPQVESMLGYTLEEWRRRENWLESVHPEDRERVLS